MFTPVETSIGAFLLHQATSVLLYNNGKVLGVSGYLRHLFGSPTKDTVAMFVGMIASFLPLKLFVPELLTKYPPVPSTLEQALLTVGMGLLVGWGTKLAHGCTSGHMLCGLSRLSARSAVAVATFFPSAMITHHLIHPSLRTEVCAGDVPCYMPIYPSRATTNSLVVLVAATVLTARTVPQLVARFVTKDEDKSYPESSARLATQFLAGLEFGLGLHISQMASPAKVVSFLSFPNLDAWDPSMALVLVFGILPSLIENQLKGFSRPPSFSYRFEIPKHTSLKDVDWKMVSGAAIFGAGWGMSGTCPGPAILRAFAQPTWGFLWMGGFWFGGQIVAG